MRFSWIRTRGVVAVSAAVMALQGAPVLAQFVPYGGNPNQGYNQYQAHTAQQAQPQYAQPQYAQPQYTQPQYAQPQYTAMAYQGSATRALNQPVEAIGPGAVQGSAPMQSHSPAPAVSYSQPAPAPTSYESYSSNGGCASGSCGTYNTFEGGGCGVGAPYGACNTGCGVGGGGYLGAGNRGCGNRWFGGFYGLYLQRAGSAWTPLAFSTDQPVPYYPTRTDYVLNLQDITETEHAGAEVRFGSTFGGAGIGCGPRFAWEAAYWGLVDEDGVASFTDPDITAGDRLYSNVDFRGIEYDPDGAGPLGYRPLNEYMNYGPPTIPDGAGDPIRVNSITVRSRFSAQNIELNLLRLPVLSGGCGTGSCGGCASDSCGIGRGGLGRGRLGGGYGGPRYSLTTLVGARYLRLDEDFSLGIDAENTITSASIPFFFASEADNHLFGLQLGCNGVYRLGCSGRWALNCSANAGIYGNRAEVTRSLTVPAAGVARYVGGTNDPFTVVNSEDDSFATIAELRTGVSYQYSCNWRFFGGYRALGISGVALAFDQLPNDFSSPTQVQDYINTSGSIFLHGLQGGVEFSY